MIVYRNRFYLYAPIKLFFVFLLIATELELILGHCVAVPTCTSFGFRGAFL